jgi:hypothetical protein
LVRNTEKSRTDNVSVQFFELPKKLGFDREGIGFYDAEAAKQDVKDRYVRSDDATSLECRKKIQLEHREFTGQIGVSELLTIPSNHAPAGLSGCAAAVFITQATY